jgi:hypothetical protein
MAVTMKNCVFWDVTPCGSCNILRSVRLLLVTASVVPSSPILVTLMKEALSSSETSVLKEPHGITSQRHHSSFLTCFAFLLQYVEFMPIS